MAFCSTCGGQVADGVQFCPACGAPISAAATPPPPPQNQAPPPQYQAPPPQGQYQQGVPLPDEQANKGMAILGVLLFFIPLIAGAHKTSPFVKFHTNQGAALFILWVGYSIIQGIVRAIATASLFGTAAWLTSGGWGAYAAVSLILGLIWLFPAILFIIGIINAAGGKWKPLPVIGGLKIIK